MYCHHGHGLVTVIIITVNVTFMFIVALLTITFVFTFDLPSYLPPLNFTFMYLSIFCSFRSHRYLHFLFFSHSQCKLCPLPLLSLSHSPLYNENRNHIHYYLHHLHFRFTVTVISNLISFIFALHVTFTCTLTFHYHRRTSIVTSISFTVNDFTFSMLFSCRLSLNIPSSSSALIHLHCRFHIYHHILIYHCNQFYC